MNYPLVMVSAPRSGSHMLATALSSHPNLNFVGEWRNNERESNHVADAMNFPIIHAMSYNREILSDIPEKVIVIRRELRGRYLSKWSHGNSNGVSVKYRYTEATTLELGTVSVPAELQHIPVIGDSQLLLDEFIEGHPNALVLDYDEITGGVDTRELPEAVANQVCDYLDIDRAPLTPGTYKPTMNYVLEEAS